MAGLRAGHARPLQTAVNGSRMKARPTEYGKVGCRAACPQAAADVCVNEKPCGLCCRGRRPRRPAEGSRPLPTMQRIKGVVMARLRAGHARPLQTAVNGSRTRGAREGCSPAPFPLTGCRGRLRAAYMPPLQRCCSPLRGVGPAWRRTTSAASLLRKHARAVDCPAGAIIVRSPVSLRSTVAPRAQPRTASKQRQFSLVLSFAAKRKNKFPGGCR